MNKFKPNNHFLENYVKSKVLSFSECFCSRARTLAVCVDLCPCTLSLCASSLNLIAGIALYFILFLSIQPQFNARLPAAAEEFEAFTRCSRLHWHSFCVACMRCTWLGKGREYNVCIMCDRCTAYGHQFCNRCVQVDALAGIYRILIDDRGKIIIAGAGSDSTSSLLIKSIVLNRK